MQVTVIGGGPSGSSAALSALREGAAVRLFEKSAFPRHKVCGEFLSPEVAGLLDQLGVWDACELEKPSTIRRVRLLMGKRTKSWRLDEPARGLSRFAMDRILLDAAVGRGLQLYRETAVPGVRTVLARGRHHSGHTNERLFGFKAHFTGPTDDIMSLYFSGKSYVGINAVEGGRVNVCGVTPESSLKMCSFDVDQLLTEIPAVAERLQPLTRAMDWLFTGPLVFGPGESPADCYGAGDAVAFIDPFTGSGMLSAISTGILAGRAAARGTDPAQYRRSAERLVRGQHRAAAFFRSAISNGLAEMFLPILPGRLLFHATRPARQR